jgi:hypothetical protein
MPLQLVLIMSLMLPTPWRDSAPRAEVRHIGGWTLRLHADPFTNRLACRLSKPKVDYQRQALVFHLPKRTDTSAAVYRIDGEPPLWARADDMEMVRSGFTLRNDDLDNPSGGLVRIPERRVLEAHAVAVETRANGRTVKFKIDGFRAALDAAHEAGCGVGDFR